MFFNASKIRTVLTAFAVLTVSACAGRDNILYWADFLVDYRFHKKLKLNFEQSFWHNSDRLYIEETILQLEWDILNWLSIAAGDRLVEQKFDEGNKWDWRHEHRPMLTLTSTHELWGFRLAWRNRLEYRDKEATRRSYLRYRSRIKLRTPWEWTDWRISPYASWETFVEDKPGLGKGDMFNRLRSLFGLSMRPADCMTLSFFYMTQLERSPNSGWKPFHVPGMELKFAF